MAKYERIVFWSYDDAKWIIKFPEIVRFIVPMKKALALFFAILFCLSLAGCAPTRTVHCDNCGKEIRISADSGMDEDWILFCKDCEKELGLDNMVEER